MFLRSYWVIFTQNKELHPSCSQLDPQISFPSPNQADSDDKSFPAEFPSLKLKIINDNLRFYSRRAGGDFSSLFF